ncbi:MAG: hypothetical protein ABI609_03715 [Acidobacteriota bacterium]
MSDLPVACSLSVPALREREAGLLRSLADRVEQREEIENGLRLRFPAEEIVLADIAELIRLERACCPFLRFELTVEPSGGPLHLQLSGPPGTREFLAGLPLGAPPRSQ